MKNKTGFRNILILLLSCICFQANATNWYFSSAGNDATGTGAIGLPWKTVAKFNSIVASKAPGDFFLFNGGDVFIGPMIVGRAGSSGLPITIGSYGTGKATITGFVSVTAWTNLGSNKWESTGAVSTLPYTNMVVVNNVNTVMGREPNTGTYMYQSHVALTSLTSTSLNSAVNNWTNAEVAFNTTSYFCGRDLIIGHSGSTITYQSVPVDNVGIQFNNQRFVIQNDPRTLDMQNEWYYNPTTKKLMIYSTSSPTGVQIPTVDVLVTVDGKGFITFDGITFTGSNKSSILIHSSPNLSIRNCDFNFEGINTIYGIFGSNSANCLIQGCTINNSNSNGIDLSEDYTNAIIRSNTVTNCGTVFGMGNNNAYTNFHNSYSGIIAHGVGTLVELNRVDHVGLSGIKFFESNTTVQNNYVTYFCQTLHDGGGIYTWDKSTGATHTGIRILNNIVRFGPAAGSFPTDRGIYMDDRSNGIELSGNTVTDCAQGVILHNNWLMNFHHNTVFNNTANSYGFMIFNDDTQVAPGQTFSAHHLTVKNNIFFGKVATEHPAYYSQIEKYIGLNLVSDSNYFVRPIDDNLTIYAYILTPAPNGTFTNRNLAQWRTYTTAQGHSQDANSFKSPRSITNVNQLLFLTDTTNAVITPTLPAGVWVDALNTPYTGTITLQPYQTVVLINTGTTNIAPTANSGIDQTIQLPTSSVSLAGSGSDVDGTITTYAWTKVSGTGGTITTPAAASTTITGLTGGVYQFKLTVTDNFGATGSDLVNITVNPANVNPTANAGTDQAIQLPVSSTTLTGSGSDPDGSITAYLWTRLSGPNTPTIVSSTSASTSVTGLIAGTYVFNLRVTDNQAATGNDQITVIVSASANVAPTANAGIDQSIQLPTTTASLVGSGNDPDGTIASYAWTQVSGAVAAITSPSSASTGITGMISAGTYQFKLTVTDNGGLTGSDNIIITVTPANIPPLVNAGTDQTITSPTTSVTLSGSASDPDGTISSHVWTKISGTGGTITTNTSYSTTVTGLTVGTYVYRLTATDNQSLTGFDEMTVTVNTAINVNPTAIAGSDQVLTWPTNSTTLVGSGTDPDGVIVAYNWAKLSGPSATITNPTSATTTITGLAVGVYQLQLQVTDNSGGTGTDVMQITVNQGTGTIAATGTTVVFNNLPQLPTIETTPPGISTSTTLDGVTGGKTHTGSYRGVTGSTDNNFIVTPITYTFTINPAPGTITVSNLLQVFDNTGKVVSVSTSPTFTTVTTYDGSSSPSISAGSHTVITRSTDADYTVTPDTSILVITQATPTLTSWLPTTPITYGTALGGAQLNAIFSVAGVSTYTPGAGFVPNAGSLTILDNFVPTDANYKSLTGIATTITVNKAVATITVADTNQNFDNTDKHITPVLSPNVGTVTILYGGSPTLPKAIGDYPFTVTYSDANYTATTFVGTLHITSNVASIFISNYQNRIYTGFPISPTVTTAYSYAITFDGSATVPTAAGSYTAIAHITDGVHVGADTVTMTIITANPTIVWPPTSPIVFGTALSSTQYNHTSTVAGTFTNSPLIGVLLSVGVAQVLNTTFTPTDLSNYNIVTATNTITVTKAAGSLSLSNLTQVYDSTLKSVNVNVSPSGLSGIVVTYTGISPTVYPASVIPPRNSGSYSVNAHSTSGNYNINDANGTLTILKGQSIITWPRPSQIVFPAPLSALQLNATVNRAGQLDYTPGLGAIFSPGTQSMTVRFTPTNPNYNTASKTVSITIIGNTQGTKFFFYNGQFYFIKK